MKAIILLLICMLLGGCARKNPEQNTDASAAAGQSADIKEKVQKAVKDIIGDNISSRVNIIYSDDDELYVYNTGKKTSEKIDEQDVEYGQNIYMGNFPEAVISNDGKYIYYLDYDKDDITYSDYGYYPEYGDEYSGMEDEYYADYSEDYTGQDDESGADYVEEPAGQEGESGTDYGEGDSEPEYSGSGDEYYADYSDEYSWTEDGYYPDYGISGNEYEPSYYRYYHGVLRRKELGSDKKSERISGGVREFRLLKNGNIVYYRADNSSLYVWSDGVKYKIADEDPGYEISKDESMLLISYTGFKYRNERNEIYIYKLESEDIAKEEKRKIAVNVNDILGCSDDMKRIYFTRDDYGGYQKVRIDFGSGDYRSDILYCFKDFEKLEEVDHLESVISYIIEKDTGNLYYVKTDGKKQTGSCLVKGDSYDEKSFEYSYPERSSSISRKMAKDGRLQAEGEISGYIRQYFKNDAMETLEQAVTNSLYGYGVFCYYDGKTSKELESTARIELDEYNTDNRASMIPLHVIDEAKLEKKTWQELYDEYVRELWVNVTGTAAEDVIDMDRLLYEYYHNPMSPLGELLCTDEELNSSEYGEDYTSYEDPYWWDYESTNWTAAGNILADDIKKTLTDNPYVVYTSEGKAGELKDEGFVMSFKENEDCTKLYYITGELKRLDTEWYDDMDFESDEGALYVFSKSGKENKKIDENVNVIKGAYEEDIYYMKELGWYSDTGTLFNSGKKLAADISNVYRYEDDVYLIGETDVYGCFELYRMEVDKPVKVADDVKSFLPLGNGMTAVLNDYDVNDMEGELILVNKDGSITDIGGETGMIVGELTEYKFN